MTILSRTKGATHDAPVALILFCAIGLLFSIGVTMTACVLDPTTYVQE